MIKLKTFFFPIFCFLLHPGTFRIYFKFIQTSNQNLFKNQTKVQSQSNQNVFFIFQQFDHFKAIIIYKNLRYITYRFCLPSSNQIPTFSFLSAIHVLKIHHFSFHHQSSSFTFTQLFKIMEWNNKHVRRIKKQQ